MEGNATRDGFARRSLLVGLIAVAFALSCSSAAAAAVVTTRDSMEPALVDRINDARAAHGLRRLRVSSLLTNAATRHANSMGAVGYFKDELYTPSHSVMWTSYGTWIDWYWPGAGYTSGAAGENRTWGAPDLSARAAVKRWMNSARNRANLLTATWRRVGVAAVRVSDPLGYFGGRERVTIVVAEFGRRRDQVNPAATSSPEDNLVREDMAFILYSSGLLSYQTNVDKYGTCDVGEAYATQSAPMPCKGLMYSAALHTPQASWGWWAPYQEALNEGYVLHKPDGSLCFGQAGYQYGIDVGDPNAQQDFIRGIRTKMAQYPGIEGFFIDGANRDVQSFCGGSFPQEYPTLAAWDAAMIEWAQVVGQAARDSGIYLIASAGGWCASCGDQEMSTEYWFRQIAPYFPALNVEHWLSHTASPRLFSTGAAWDQQWNERTNFHRLANSLGVDFYALDGPNSVDTNAEKVYTRGSFLLDWTGDGGGHFNTLTCGYGCGDQWPGGEAAFDVGQPVSAKVQVGVGYRREFTLAYVLVNPDPAMSQSFSVGGSTVTLPPVTARIIGK